MTDKDSDIHRLEIKLAKIEAYNEAAKKWISIFGLMVLAWLGYTSIYQIPKESDKIIEELKLNDAVKKIKEFRLTSETDAREISKLKEKLISDFNTIENILEIAAPIGSIVGLHIYDTSQYDIPDGWIECNGQRIEDNESTLNGKYAPNLNEKTGMGRFLRGTLGKTGELQDATKHPFIWAIGKDTIYYPNVPQAAESYDFLYNTPKSVETWKVSSVTGKVITGGGDPNKGHSEQYYTSRPKSATVRWIMRIK